MKKLNLQEIEAVSGAGHFSLLQFFCPPSQKLPPVSTKAIGEEDCLPEKPSITTLAIGEEGDHSPEIDCNPKPHPFGKF